MRFRYLPEATHHPARDLSYATEGHEIARVAKMLGRTLMPWQRKAVDVATEYRLDEFGRRHYRYSKVVITVPRQSGKTTLMGPLQLHRIMTRAQSKAFFTAQTGQDAKKRMIDLIELVTGSAAAPLFKPTYANGAEGIAVKGKGSAVTRFSPTLSALHGETPLLVTFDEIWKYSLELGNALLGAAGPGQITFGDLAQIVMISTMGTLDSEFMNEWVDKGRAGTDPTLCYIEYSMPAGLDPYAPSTWWTFHPALGNTITEAGLMKDINLPKSEWMRAYMNRLTATEHQAIDLDIWDDLGHEEHPQPNRRDLVLGIEVAPDNRSAAVMAAWRDKATGRPCMRLVYQAPGTAWLPGFVAEQWAHWQPADVVADGAGPVGRFVRAINDALREHPDNPSGRDIVRTLNVAEFGAACETVMAAARDERTLWHDGSPELRDAVAALELRTVNGVRKFSRDHSPRPIATLVGGTVALYGYDHPALVESGPVVF